MPPKKGRKRRPERGQGREAPSSPRIAAMPPSASLRPPIRAQSPLPSRNARMSGFVVSLVTAFLAILLIRDASTNASGADAIVRIVAGVGLVGLALIVASLVLFPERLQRYLARRRR